MGYPSNAGIPISSSLDFLGRWLGRPPVVLVCASFLFHFERRPQEKRCDYRDYSVVRTPTLTVVHERVSR